MRALGDPPVLIFDEPFNGMDPEGIVWMKGSSCLRMSMPGIMLDMMPDMMMS